MIRKLPVLALSFATLSVAQAQTPSAPQCPFAPEYLAAHFSHPFKAGKPENGILGKACSYEANGIKLWLDAGPNPAPTAEMYRKMSNPPGTSWAAVAGDADKAVHLVPKSPDDAYPSLSYERKGWLVIINVTGVKGKAGVAAWNAKLEQLKRIP